MNIKGSFEGAAMSSFQHFQNQAEQKSKRPKFHNEALSLSGLFQYAESAEKQSFQALCRLQPLVKAYRDKIAETSRAMHFLIQRIPSKGATDVVPDEFESWYAAKSDAEAGITIAEQMAKQAEGLLDPGIDEGQGKISSSFTKTAVGTKKRVPSVFELFAAGGHQPGMIKKLEGAGLEASVKPVHLVMLRPFGKLVTRAIAARVQTLSLAMKIHKEKAWDDRREPQPNHRTLSGTSSIERSVQETSAPVMGTQWVVIPQS